MKSQGPWSKASPAGRMCSGQKIGGRSEMNNKRRTSILFFSLTLFLAACGSNSVKPGTKIEGLWGAEHLELVANNSGALLEYDCAIGTIDSPLILDANGKFDLVGTHTVGGGPVNLNDPPEAQPALFQGRVRDKSLELTVTLTNTGDVIGPYILVRGEPGLLYRCL